MKKATQEQVTAEFKKQFERTGKVDTRAVIATQNKQGIFANSLLFKVAADEVFGITHEYTNHCYQESGTYAKMLEVAKQQGYTGYI